MSNLEEIRREFWDAWNGLSQVHTQEALEVQSEKMWAARKRLLKVDPEFRVMLKVREDKIEEEAEENMKRMQIKREQIISKAEAEVSAAKVKVRAVTGMPEAELDEWVQKHRFKILASEEAETRSKRKLICPICHDPDYGNTLNDKPACIKCMHVLVPESELKNYNRAYRRRWRRSRKS